MHDAWQRWTDWIDAHPEAVAGLALLSLLTLLASAAAVPVVVARLPADHFVRLPTTHKSEGHPLLRLALRLLKSALGALLVGAGFAMLFLPGQGLLTLLAGLGLLEFPGKRRLELWVLRRRSVRRAVAWLRRRAGRPPLLLPDGLHSDSGVAASPRPSEEP
ncbi:MAG: hypothetical protein D6731_04820 [Planctomycetota bacterium]|nr:MAG: hypothetical protein D6731_04820 [Planctomycetota bacterium]